MLKTDSQQYQQNENNLSPKTIERKTKQKTL